MIRYPIFVFEGDAFEVYNTREEHWNQWEPYALEYAGLLFDSDGRILLASYAGNDRVEISDSGAEPDLEQLRALLIHALHVRGQEWELDARLESLIAAAQVTNDMAGRTTGIGEAVTSLLRLLHLKKRAS